MMTPTIRALAAICALGLAAPAPAQDATSAPEAAPAAGLPLEERGYALGAQSIGSADAPVTMVEYASLTCPHCAAFHTETLPRLKRDYIDTGKLRLEFHEVYFDQFGLWAGMISRCGGEEPYFNYIGTFFGQLNEWAHARDITAELMRIGRLGGLSQERLAACLSDEALMRVLVADFQEASARDSVTSTPTFLIGDRRFSGNKPYEDIAAWIDEELTEN